MTTIAILFWAGVFLVFYTYLGYGILLWTLVKIREALRPARRHEVPAEAPEVTLANARALLASHGGLDLPTLVLTDIFGATPSNVAQKLVQDLPARLIAGVNLPMLLRSICYREEPLEQLLARAATGGSQGVMQVGVSAPLNQSSRPSSHDQDQNHHQQ